MDMFWWMIGGVVTLALVALATALYMWKLYKDFPETMKAKIVSVEKVASDEDKEGYRYHFKGRNKGNRMMTDCVTYKEKKLRVGDKMTVRMSKDGHTCHSNFPMWPAVTSAICILLAFVVAFAYISDKQVQTLPDNVEILAQENGYYIVTDAGVLFKGDNMGLVQLVGETPSVSTGDYGFIAYQGEPHYEYNDAALMAVHAAHVGVITDGTVETLDAALVEEVQGLGFTINTVSTIASEIVVEEHYEGDGHDHSHDAPVTENETEGTIPVESESATESSDTAAESTEPVVETGPAETATEATN